jgi:hypothetical protein
MPKDRVALQFLADFKSIFSHLTNIFGPNAISHASNTYVDITFEIKSPCVFAEKYQFYKTILAASLHLGREAWKNLMVYLHKL